DDLAIRLGPEAPPGRPVDAVLDEANAAVAEQDVASAGVVACGADAEARVRPGVGSDRKILATAADGILMIVGRLHHVKHRITGGTETPPPALEVGDAGRRGPELGGAELEVVEDRLRVGECIVDGAG